MRKEELINELKKMTTTQRRKIFWDLEKGSQKKFTVRGEAHPNSKLTWKKVEEIRSLQGQMGFRKVSAKYGVCNDTIKSIWRNQSWVIHAQ